MTDKSDIDIYMVKLINAAQLGVEITARIEGKAFDSKAFAELVVKAQVGYAYGIYEELKGLTADGLSDDQVVEKISHRAGDLLEYLQQTQDQEV